MSVSETSQPPFGSPVPKATPPALSGHRAAGDATQESYQQCDECGAPVDSNQRYCVVCGAHRRHVNDPAARYLSHATARARTSGAAVGAGRAARSGGRSRGLGTALVLAVIPVAAAAGVMVGRSSNSEDAKLIQALARRQAAVVASTATTPAATTSATAPSAARRARHTKRHTASARTTSSTKNAGKVISTTQYGSVSQITGAKPTRAQEQQGAHATQQVQKSTGKTYVNQQSNLPGTVVVP